MEANAYREMQGALGRLYVDAPHPWLVVYSGGKDNRFDEAGTAAFLLKGMDDRQVQLPGKHHYWPDKPHLEWHRGNKLRSALVN